MCNLPESAELYLDAARGVYIPQNFAEMTRPDCIEGLSDKERDILLSGPDHDEYWDVWNDVEQNVIIVDGATRFRLYQDGDLWIIPVDAEWPEQ